LPVSLCISSNIKSVDLSEIKREDYKNVLLLEIGGENIIIGMSYYYFVNKYNVIGITLGSWIYDISGGIAYRYFFLRNTISLYTGSSVMLYSGSLRKININKYKVNISALGLYFPIGIQYSFATGLIMSIELSTYFISKAELIYDRSKKDKAFQKAFWSYHPNPNFWGGIKIGIRF